LQLKESSAPYPALRSHVKHCEALLEFKATYFPLFAPNS
jgi:hypothetical protein